MFAIPKNEMTTAETQPAVLVPHQPSFSGQVLSMGPSDLLTASSVTSQATMGSEVVEIPVLLPGWQAMALEDAAHLRGLTAGEMLRHLLSDFFTKPRTQPNGPEARQSGSQVAWS
jgi:hypothetical protein